MLEAPILSRRSRSCLTSALSLTACAFLVSCASQDPQPALVSDPDAQHDSALPWNRPQTWEGRGNVPPGFGDTSNPGRTGGY